MSKALTKSANMTQVGKLWLCRNMTWGLLHYEWSNGGRFESGSGRRLDGWTSWGPGDGLVDVTGGLSGVLCVVVVSSLDSNCTMQ